MMLDYAILISFGFVAGLIIGINIATHIAEDKCRKCREADDEDEA